ncbi:hypothetical protein SLH33_10710 [Tenacibaculum sp. IB213877]|nr:hypothetical protein [Tenacibaculum sp. IB213877]
MSEGLKEKINALETELESLPKITSEPKIQLLFSGSAVKGSKGIKSGFVSKTIAPFQEMVKTQTTLLRFGKVGKRGRTKKSANTDLFLTALPIGSFGIELSQLESNDLFDSMDVSNAIKQVVNLIASSAQNDNVFEKAFEKVPKRNLSNLKKLLEVVSEENSILKMETNEIGIYITEKQIKEAFQRVSETIDNESEKIVTGIFRGILLDSGKFEIQDELGKKISGFINPDLTEDDLIRYDKTFLNNECLVHLKIHKTTFKTGFEKTEYELLEIRSLKQGF